MSRDISATNLTEIGANHVQLVTLVNFAFDTPVYAHSGIGTITYDSNDYLGVGALGAIGNVGESENLTPAPLTLTLSGVDSDLIAEALDSGNYGDVVTIYEGYRQDDGTLVDDPWIAWKGTHEYGSISHGENSTVTVTVKHDLANLSEKDGGRFTDEDQQSRYSGDVAFEYIADMAGTKLSWGGRAIGGVAGKLDHRPRPQDEEY